MNFTADQFKAVKVKRATAVKAFFAYVTVYRNSGHHVLIGAPTLDALEDIWKQLEPDTPLVRDCVQAVNLIKADESESGFVVKQ